MTLTLTVRDETTTGDRHDAITLEFLTERITVRELIRSRVYQEVQDYNTKPTEIFRGLVQPEETEQVLNGYRRLGRPKSIDWKVQFERAIEAFEANRVLVLIDDRQAAGLEEEIVLRPETSVSFLRLIPLVGG